MVPRDSDRFNGCIYSPYYWHEYIPEGVALNERILFIISCERRAYPFAVRAVVFVFGSW